MLIDVMPNETEDEALARVRALPAEAERVAREMSGYVDAEDEAVRDGWRIEDVGGLDWALSRIADLEREVAENKAVTERRIQWLRLRLEKLNATAESGLRFFRSRVEAYAAEHRAELLGGGKKKSRALPHGSVGWRKRGGGLSVADREALLEWAREQPVEAGLVRIKEEPAVDEVKRLFKRTGEVPPGCEVEPEVEELVIKAVGED